jgi:hypothetical protein
MKDKVRCKACGFILDKDALGEVCPACGVKREFFEPWEEPKIGDLRRKLLDMHLHPIIVHIPNSLAPLLFLMALVYPLIPAEWQRGILWPSIQLFSWLFPLAALGGYLSGLFDAKVRYKTVSAPLLLKKAWLGILFFIASLVCAVLVSVSDFGSAGLGTWIAYVVGAAIALFCASVLGHWGSPLVVGVMPGPKIFKGKKKAPKKVG